MKTAIIAKFLLETEDVVALRDMNIPFKQKVITIGTIKVPCYCFHGLSEDDVFNKLDIRNISKMTLTEAGDNVSRTFVSRAWSVLFTQINKVNKLPNDSGKISAICALLATCTSMASLDVNLANRLLQLIRNI